MTLRPALKLLISFALAVGFTLSPALSMNAPQEKTYNIRNEIMNFYRREDVQDRINEDTDSMWKHNIHDIKAHFSKIVKNPAAFSLALNRIMNPSGPLIKTKNGTLFV